MTCLLFMLTSTKGKEQKVLDKLSDLLVSIGHLIVKYRATETTKIINIVNYSAQNVEWRVCTIGHGRY